MWQREGSMALSEKRLALEALNTALVARAREITQEAVTILRNPQPDTFLGRKTQEPFPEEKTD
jgi:hypothetical protein